MEVVTHPKHIYLPIRMGILTQSESWIEALVYVAPRTCTTPPHRISGLTQESEALQPGLTPVSLSRAQREPHTLLCPPDNTTLALKFESCLGSRTTELPELLG